MGPNDTNPYPDLSPRRRHLLGWLAAAGLAPALGACTRPQGPLRVGSIVFPGYEMLFLARELGFLDSRQVRLIEFLSNADALRALASGQLDAAALTLDECLGARAEGLDLRVVLTQDISHGADVVLARPGLSLQTLRDQRIGLEENTSAVVMFSALLQAAGLQVEQVRKVPMSVTNAMQDYLAGRIDALVTFEPWAAQLEAQGAVRIFDSTAIPNRMIDVLAVRHQALAENPAAVRHLVAAHFSGLDHYAADPADASRRMAPRLQTAPADVPAAFRGLRLLDRAANQAHLRAGGQLEQLAGRLQHEMMRAGLMREPRMMDTLCDARFLPPLPKT